MKEESFKFPPKAMPEVLIALYNHRKIPENINPGNPSHLHQIVTSLKGGVSTVDVTSAVKYGSIPDYFMGSPMKVRTQWWEGEKRRYKNKGTHFTLERADLYDRDNGEGQFSKALQSVKHLCI